MTMVMFTSYHLKTVHLFSTHSRQQLLQQVISLHRFRENFLL